MFSYLYVTSGAPKIICFDPPTLCPPIKNIDLYKNPVYPLFYIYPMYIKTFTFLICICIYSLCLHTDLFYLLTLVSSVLTLFLYRLQFLLCLICFAQLFHFVLWFHFVFLFHIVLLFHFVLLFLVNRKFNLPIWIIRAEKS